MPAPENVFAEQVAAQVERLKITPLRIIEAEVAAKRKGWLQQNPALTASKPGNRPHPRIAFEALFFDYMGLRPEDLPILQENETEIVWASQNACPTLAACGRLGLDTRVVCRKAYEKSTQAFVSAIDPELRFLRNYRQIRPYADRCEERIVRVDFRRMMGIAIAEAHASLAEGNKGYGAVAALGNCIVARAHDTAVSQRDPSLHAEVNALRATAAVLSDGNLCGVVLFSTCEPCPMCSSLAVWSNVSAIVYGASIEETVARGKSRIRLSAREVIDRSPVMMEVYGGVLRQECLELYC